MVRVVVVALVLRAEPVTTALQARQAPRVALVDHLQALALVALALRLGQVTPEHRIVAVVAEALVAASAARSTAALAASQAVVAVVAVMKPWRLLAALERLV